MIVSDGQIRRFAVIAIVMLLSVSFASEAFAQRRQRRAPRQRPQPVTVPFNIGVGPAALFITGPIQDDQLAHGAVIIDTFAVLDAALIRKFAHRVPRQYRAALAGQPEVRFRPAELALVPSNIIVSPKINGTGMYGLTLRPIGLGTAFYGSGTRFGIKAGLDLTYIFIHSDTVPSPTHFLRPGLDLQADFEVAVTESFLFSIGWRSTLYPPQEVGGSILAWGELDQSIWHIGQAYLMLHGRVPVTRRF